MKSIDEKKVRLAFVEQFGENPTWLWDENSIVYQAFLRGYRKGYLHRSIEALDEMRQLENEIRAIQD